MYRRLHVRGMAKEAVEVVVMKSLLHEKIPIQLTFDFVPFVSAVFEDGAQMTHGIECRTYLVSYIWNKWCTLQISWNQVQNMIWHLLLSLSHETYLRVYTEMRCH